MSALKVRDIISRYLAGLRCKQPASVHCQLRGPIRLLGEFPAEELRGHHLSDYRFRRREDGVSDVTVNRELAYLRAAYNQALDEELISRKPPFRLIRERNVRERWITLEELERLLRKLPWQLRDYVEFLWWTGWRKSQAACLMWEHYDADKQLLLAPGVICKSGQATAFPVLGKVEAIIGRRISLRNGPWIFHRNGKQIRDMRVAWKRATEKADLEGLHIHDLRRSMATHHLERGIPQATTMRLAGWLTDSMYRRYAIVHRGALHSAAEAAMHDTD